MLKRNDITIITLFLLLPLCIALVNGLTGNNQGTSDVGSSSFLQSFGKTVGVVKVEGVIYSAHPVVDELKAMRLDKNVAVILLRINTPGGSVAPSQEIYQEVLRCREKKPVIVSMETIAASGGYYIASAGTKIYANSGTLTGSIGVIMQFPYYGELLNKLGVGMHTITAGKLKDAGSPYRDLKESERDYFEALIKDTHKQFIADIAVGRGVDTTVIKPHAEGEIFTGKQALGRGLIDKIGDLEVVKSDILKNYNLPNNTRFISKKKKKQSYFELMESKVTSIIAPFTQKGGVYYLAEPLL